MGTRWDLPTLLLLLLVAVVASLFLAGVARANRRLFPIAAAGLALWLAYSGALAWSGGLIDTAAMPPPFVRLMPPAVAVALLIAFSPVGKSLAGLPYAALIGFHAFRVPLEFLLYSFHAQGRLPVQMTFAGRNFDVLTGLTAVAAAWLAAKGRAGRRVALAWNVFGLILLLNIMAVAILSLPGPTRRFLNDPPNELVTHFPYVYIPAVFVVLALAGHLILFRKVAREG